jgi:formamidopyrimidine-DNA glycosylase
LPELPEVETVRRDLLRLYAGHRLKSLSVSGRRTVRRHSPEQLGALREKILLSVGRHGKYLVFFWEGGPSLVAHLRMSGQLLAASPGDPVAPHTHAVFSFDGAGELRFVDPRTFGELFLSTPAAAPPMASSPSALPELAHLGPDALMATARDLSCALAGRHAPLKALLVDQRVIAGIGNIYADEICWKARLRPDRPGGSLDQADLRRLVRATRSVLLAAIAARGSTLADRRYRDLGGSAGAYQLEHRVYGRAGLPCAGCGRPVERLRWGAKSAYVCGSCQA